ncbi:MAG: EAL domain-containing protein [Devosia sp.]|nr:EAL domain-containing protein [Devosia sp.]
MSVQTDNPLLVKAQYRAFSRQIPMMYFILLSSTWAVASTHFGHAPAELTVGGPILLTLVCVTRLWQWWRTRHQTPTLEVAATALRRTNMLSIAIASAFTLWALSLFPHGDAYLQSHLAFYMAITVIACIISLMHLRSAAFAVAIIVIGSFIAFFATTGQPTFIAIAVNVVLVSFGMLTMLMVNYRNFAQMITAQQETEALSNENLRLANLDSLTELPNRRACLARLEDELRAAQAGGTRVALGIIDLDGFKPVNDVYGHSTGDRLLIMVGRRLEATVAPSGVFMARLGGDEFAFIVSDAGRDIDLVEFGDSICSALRQPFMLPEATVMIAGSVGIACADGTLEPGELFDRADYALYQGKRSKRGLSTLFNAGHDAQIHREARIEQALKGADLDSELSVVFQPIIRISDESVAGFEALARWDSPIMGVVSPSEFIPVAERAGIIGSLTRPLLRKALQAASAWPDHIRLSFTLSAHDLNPEDGVAAVIGIIRAGDVSSRRLDLEITETAFTHDFEQVKRAVALLGRLGCGISLDDFGTGYSSLSRLHALPLNRLKIDRSFVAGLDGRQSSIKIVRSLLALSRDMGLECVVEGVETAAELATIRELGGELVQGFHFSPPVPLAQTAGLLDRFAGRSRPRLAVHG